MFGSSEFTELGNSMCLTVPSSQCTEKVQVRTLMRHTLLA